MENKEAHSLQLADHLNAEVVGGTVGSKQDAVDYLTWTFFFRRLIQNPSYYDLPSTENDQLSIFLSRMIETTLQSLEVAPQLFISCMLELGSHRMSLDVCLPLQLVM